MSMPRRKGVIRHAGVFVFWMLASRLNAPGHILMCASVNGLVSQSIYFYWVMGMGGSGQQGNVEYRMFIATHVTQLYHLSSPNSQRANWPVVFSVVNRELRQADRLIFYTWVTYDWVVNAVATEERAQCRMFVMLRFFKTRLTLKKLTVGLAVYRLPLYFEFSAGNI